MLALGQVLPITNKLDLERQSLTRKSSMASSYLQILF
jgi:hypothetical protein